MSYKPEFVCLKNAQRCTKGVYYLLVGDPFQSTKSPHHSRTGDPTIIESPRNSRQGAGYILLKMSDANNNNNLKAVFRRSGFSDNIGLPTTNCLMVAIVRFETTKKQTFCTDFVNS